MNLNDYHSLAQRTAKQYDTQVENLNHAALGMATEFLEAMTAGDPQHVNEETGDYCWYIPVACQALGFKLGDLVAETFGIPAEQATANWMESTINPEIGMKLTGAKATGDFISMVKRLKIYEKPLTDEMVSQAKQDILKMVGFAAWNCAVNGFTLASCLRANIDKLRKRFPDKFSNEAAEARADKGGVDARNS